MTLMKGFLFSLSMVQSDDDCCNSCEEVQEAYRRKGWAMTNVDLIDQVSLQVLFPSIFLGLLNIYMMHVLRFNGIFIFCKIFIPCSLAWENKSYFLALCYLCSFYIFFFGFPVQKRRLYPKGKR